MKECYNCGNWYEKDNSLCPECKSREWIDTEISENPVEFELLDSRKSCPFCGGNSEKLEGVDSSQTRVSYVYIKCTSCGCRTGNFSIYSKNRLETIKDCIEVWNNRIY